MHIGILGGSFDPVHLGHLILAEQCRELRQLDQVWFMPTATSPFKPQGAQAAAKQRVEMLQLAIAGNDRFQVSTLEIERQAGQPNESSYTVDTLRQMHALHPDYRWSWIIGSDSLAGFPRWREPQAIANLADLIVYARPQFALDWSVLKGVIDEAKIQHWQTQAITSLQIEISSTLLRQKIREQQSIRYLTPRAVEKLIETAKLYGG